MENCDVSPPAADDELGDAIGRRLSGRGYGYTGVETNINEVTGLNHCGCPIARRQQTAPNTRYIKFLKDRAHREPFETRNLLGRRRLMPVKITGSPLSMRDKVTQRPALHATRRDRAVRITC
ncbi:hypothetical protein EVAR_48297_1 [Eumeta japonica]|uniref:Uncharacterized protein n=1 Tax=Eumeta variegata TaxID=151549 RepID=A0A4C1WNH7_EUMVA|nr:hypothetical protein EVAR_48297_1 [Eumeta japonica]